MDENLSGESLLNAFDGSEKYSATIAKYGGLCMRVIIVPLVALLAACSKSEPEKSATSSSTEKAAPASASKAITVKITGFSKTESGAT